KIFLKKMIINYCYKCIIFLYYNLLSYILFCSLLIFKLICHYSHRYILYIHMQKKYNFTWKNFIKNFCLLYIFFLFFLYIILLIHFLCLFLNFINNFIQISKFYHSISIFLL